MNTQTYEPPALVEIGDFTELTRGIPWGRFADGFWWAIFPSICPDGC
jgi:hypothetical protein